MGDFKLIATVSGSQNVVKPRRRLMGKHMEHPKRTGKTSFYYGLNECNTVLRVFKKKLIINCFF